MATLDDIRSALSGTDYMVRPHGNIAGRWAITRNDGIWGWAELGYVDVAADGTVEQPVSRFPDVRAALACFDAVLPPSLSTLAEEGSS